MKWVSDEGLEERVLNAEGPILVAFISWISIPCDHFRPEFSGLDPLLKDVALFQIQVDENPKISEYYKVTAVPTTILFKGGTELGRWEGPYTKEALKERITEILAKKGG